MFEHPEFDPVAFAIGPLKVHWYGLMYLIGFLAGWWLGRVRAARRDSGWQAAEIGDLLFYIALGAILGGRLGYVLFYNAAYYLQHPLEMLYLWSGGMSFHGGLIGVLLSLWLYGRSTGRHFLQVGDFVAPLVPIGLGAGRIGNFINQELWGKVTAAPWGVVFPAAGADPRHPSQLYQAGLEGLVLFLVLWIFSARPRRRGAVSGLFLVLYGVFRFLVEFAREPDAHLGYLAFGWVTMGQVLSVPMIILGLVLFFYSRARRRPSPA